MRDSSGFIDICKLLNIPYMLYLNTPELFASLVDALKANPNVTLLKEKNGTNLVLNFIYENESYFFSFDSRVENFLAPLIYEEICHDLNIDVASCDIARIGNIEGYISKDFRKPNAKYISGYEILKESKVHKSAGDDDVLVPSLTSSFGEGEDLGLVLRRYNTLEGIWAALEIRYNQRPDMPQVVSKLMDKLINMFIVDLYLGNLDRNNTNWQIVEYENGEVDLAPIYDNVRTLMVHPYITNLAMPLENRTGYFDDNNLENNVMKFLRYSDKAIADKYSNNIWVLSKENIIKILERIEAKIGSPIPENQKQDLLFALEIHYEAAKTFISDYKEEMKR